MQPTTIFLMGFVSGIFAVLYLYKENKIFREKIKRLLE